MILEKIKANYKSYNSLPNPNYYITKHKFISNKESEMFLAARKLQIFK